MAGRLSTPGPKATERSIEGHHGVFYECGSLTQIDAHLKQLSVRIKICNDKMNNTKLELIEDRDKLLEYRFLLAAFLVEEPVV